MSAVLLVKGTIAYGRLHEFTKAVEAFVTFRREREDAGYGRVASKLTYVQGSITYELYQVQE